MPASDNEIARFLFAILKQKDLKDIDWNKVASDPVLPKPISNGHAARMRYFRFRNSIEGPESTQRRSRASPATRPNRVNKKKAAKSIKAEDEPQIPSYDGAGDSGPRASSVPSFGEDAMFIAPSRSTPAPSSSTQYQSRVHMRLLTPCSDSDTLATAHGYSPSPVGNEIQAAAAGTTFDFTAAATPANHENIDQWQFNTFSTDYDLNSYAPAAAYSSNTDQHLEDALGMHPALMEHERSQLHGNMVKHEEWDSAHGVDTQHYQSAGHC
ncbi:hypothetical protein V8F20_000279 [Naviculisporaceae sp. PSN 640]